MSLDGLRERLSGSLLLPQDPGFDDATRLWNGLIEKTPALVVQAMGAADVVAAVDFARQQGSPSRCGAAATTSPARRSPMGA